MLISSPFIVDREFMLEISSQIELPVLDFNFSNFKLECISPAKMTSDTSLSFLTFSNANPEIIRTLKGLILIDPMTLNQYRNDLKEKKYISVEDPKYFFAFIFNMLFKSSNEMRLKRYSVAEHKLVDETAQIAETARIHPNVVIGKNTIILDGVCIHDKTVIGDNVVIKENTVVGGRGFGYAVRNKHPPIQMPHLGGVEIGDDVHIGSFTAIDRGSFESTLIEKYSKIDNGVHIAHNVIVREGAIITAHAEISGSVLVGLNAWIGPNVSIREKVTIGNNSLVGIGSVVVKNVEENTVVAGVPARFIRRIN